MFTDQTDGIDHINIYSQGKTELGRFLSNFTRYPIETEDGPFQSIEGYWYWLSSNDDKLRELYGWQAKKYGREIKAKDWMDDEEFKRKICSAIKTKVESSKYLEQLQKCELPLDHYYVYGGKVIRPKEGRWIIDFIESLKNS
jgi:hypothetical protein